MASEPLNPNNSSHLIVNMTRTHLSIDPRRLALALFLISGLGWLAGCQNEERDSRASEDTAETPLVDAEQQLEKAHPGVLGWIIPFELTDQDGSRFASGRLTGKPWVASFISTGAESYTTQQIKLLKLLRDRLKKTENGNGVGMVSFAIDPSSVTAAALKTFTISAGVDVKRWKFLTGGLEEVQTAVNQESFKTAFGKGGENSQGSLERPSFVLVDSYQRVRGYYDSEQSSVINELMTDLAALQSEIINIPADVQDPAWMKERAQAQLKTADSISAFHGFSFTDQRESSGIQFMHKIVDDSGKRFKGVHYDHGSGIAVADIDGDDRLDIYFVNQVGGNELWRNLGGGKFENITERAGVFVSDRIGVSAAFADIDNDGDPDLFVTALRKGNVLFENLGGGKFRNITAGSGLGYKGHSSAAVFFDFDRDGLVDLLVTNVGKYTKDDVRKVTMENIRGEADIGDQYYIGFEDAFAGHLKEERLEPSRFYRNLGDRKFQDVSSELGLQDEGWTGDAAPVDINADGWVDLYMLNMQGNDQVFLNREGKRFERAVSDLFPKTSWGSMGIKAMDFENDGDLDIFITDMHSDMSEHIGPDQEKEKAAMQWPESFLRTEGNSIFGNAFFRLTDGGRYEEVSDQLGAENYWPWGLSVDDLNADGFDDAFLTSSMNFPLRYGVNSLLLNDGGERWRDAEFIVGVEPRAGGLAVPWFELDMLGADREAPVLEILKNEGADPDSFPDRVVVWGAMGSRSSAIFDLDDDGDLDIVTNEMNHHPMVLLSDLSDTKPDFAFLKVKLIGTISNRSALGAVVRLRAGDLHLMKVKDGQSGYLSHSDFPLYFGLGAAEKIDQLEVHWPSGIVQKIEGPILLNEMITITEKGDRAEGAVARPPQKASLEPLESGPIHVRPGDNIQEALELAARNPRQKRIVVHAGVYRPQRPGQAMIWFNERHDGITLEAEGEVVLTAANPALADKSAPSFPAIVNHVVYFGDGISRKTVLSGFKITGANGFVTNSEEPVSIQAPIEGRNLEKAKFFYTDGGGIKIFGRSYPRIENVEVYDNFTSPCGAGVSVEHRGHIDGSRLQTVLLRDCVFRNNRCPISGAAVDLLHGSGAEIVNCLFVDNLSNGPMDQRAETPGKWKPQHGSGALTLFPESQVIVRRCTFTGNRNAVDDSNQDNRYEDSIFWMNNAAGGWPTGSRYELDLASGVGVSGCFIGGDMDDLRAVIDKDQNVVGCSDPRFDERYVPQAQEFEGVGYRPH